MARNQLKAQPDKGTDRRTQPGPGHLNMNAHIHIFTGNETSAMNETVQLIITMVGVFIFSFMFGIAMSKKR